MMEKDLKCNACGHYFGEEFAGACEDEYEVMCPRCEHLFEVRLEFDWNVMKFQRELGATDGWDLCTVE
uniref:Cysteine-rich CPXCG n=1 Tax=Candidatus Kentrum sp. UNK TaxID=2126344 RepID=A0A450ZWR2_9GAMM|nr:MAG: hypothetical protein BECKUNK1418G_GA0071005_100260 [Candidatus Kentron sp. UNK]VFK68331.1 MAG: hypothetical protein BECKUNK1418H_GA0071006_100160 [Candidatus Kentron sp. UNK]